MEQQDQQDQLVEMNQAAMLMAILGFAGDCVTDDAAWAAWYKSAVERSERTGYSGRVPESEEMRASMGGLIARAELATAMAEALMGAVSIVPRQQDQDQEPAGYWDGML